MIFTSYNFDMSFTWTPHRFAGGALALDVANSVILRSDPIRSLDRFSEPDNLAAFPTAAMEFSAERALFGSLEPVKQENVNGFIRLREAIDQHFRARVSGQHNRHSLAELLEAVATVLRAAPSDHAIEAATAHSALRLLTSDTERLKICGNCGWLFLDKSKNRSRTWCDMAVCGNRVKASRHYHRTKEENDP